VTTLSGVTRPVTARHAISRARATPPRAIRILARPALSTLAGVAVWTAFPPLNWWPMAAVGVAAFTVVVATARLRVAAGCGWRGVRRGSARRLAGLGRPQRRPARPASYCRPGRRYRRDRRGRGRGSSGGLPADRGDVDRRAVACRGRARPGQRAAARPR